MSFASIILNALRSRSEDTFRETTGTAGTVLSTEIFVPAPTPVRVPPVDGDVLEMVIVPATVATPIPVPAATVKAPFAEFTVRTPSLFTTGTFGLVLSTVIAVPAPTPVIVPPPPPPEG